MIFFIGKERITEAERDFERVWGRRAQRLACKQLRELCFYMTGVFSNFNICFEMCLKTWGERGNRGERERGRER